MPRFQVPWTITGSTVIDGADDEAHAAKILEDRVIKEGWASIAANDHDDYDISDKPQDVTRLPSEPKNWSRALGPLG